MTKIGAWLFSIAFTASIFAERGVAAYSPSIPKDDDANASKSHIYIRLRLQGVKKSCRRNNSTNTISWGACDAEELQFGGVQCGLLQVPLDYNHPEGDTITLALSRVVHTSTDYRGIMLTNPGGPGVAGRPFALLGNFVPRGIGAKYDWIGIDPRGAGGSQPALLCASSYLEDIPKPTYEPKTVEIETAWLNRSKVYADACHAKSSYLLPHMTTENHVRDMESIRIALRSEKMNFYGYSYGTSIGQTYATLFPDKVGRFVLDSVVDNSRSTYEAINLDQIYAAQVVYDKWFAWVAQYDGIYQLGANASDVEARWNKARAELEASPADGLIGSAEWDDIFAQCLHTSSWVSLADLLSDWIATKNVTTLRMGYPSPLTGNFYAGYLSVICREDIKGNIWPKYENYKLDVSRAVEDGAYAFAWSNGFGYNGPCLFWNTETIKQLEPIRDYDTQILFINTEFDSATPYSGAFAARQIFRKSILLGIPGGINHAQSLSGDNCVDGLIADYLDSGVLPPRKPGKNVADFECESPPLPNPVLGVRDFEERAISSVKKDSREKEMAVLRKALRKILDRGGYRR